MNLLGNLRSRPGGRRKKHRLGRGKGSGFGGTSTKGHKGQKARSGYKPLKGFEGGGQPLIRRLPKFGFTRVGTPSQIFNLKSLNRFEKEVTPEMLHKAGLLKKGEKLRILSSGELKKPLHITAHHFSARALEKIKKAGGKADLLKAKSGSSGKASLSKGNDKKTGVGGGIKPQSETEPKAELKRKAEPKAELQSKKESKEKSQDKKESKKGRGEVKVQSKADVSSEGQVKKSKPDKKNSAGGIKPQSKAEPKTELKKKAEPKAETQKASKEKPQNKSESKSDSKVKVQSKAEALQSKKINQKKSEAKKK